MAFDIQGFIESIGIILILSFIIKGLKNQIKSLNELVKTQNETIKAMEKRILETEKIGELYKNLIEDMPKAVRQYKNFIASTKDEIIKELQNAKNKKDDELRKLKERRLSEIEKYEKILSQVPTLIKSLYNLFSSFEYSNFESINFSEEITKLEYFQNEINDLKKLENFVKKIALNKQED